jgi:tetratricopeptide (TPR) repeat protein
MRRLSIVFLIIVFHMSAGISQSSEELLTRGAAHLKMENYDRAVEHFTRYLETANNNLQGFLGRAEAYVNLGDLEKALADFSYAEQISEGAGNYGLARTYALMGNASMAVKYLEKHLMSDHKLPEKIILLEKSFEKIEGSRDWRNLWRNDWYTDFEVFVREINYHISKASYTEALDGVNRKLQEDPENPELYHLKARIQLGLGEYKQALTSCDLALRYQKDTKEYLLTKSSVLARMGKHQEALKPMNRLIYLDPVDLDLYPVRARLYAEAGDPVKAIDDISHYLDYIDTDKEALLFSGNLHQEIGKIYPALENFNKLIELDQSNPVYFIARGKAFTESGTFQYAISDFGMALDLDPDNADTYLERGKVFLEIDDRDNACYDLKMALEKGNRQAADLVYKYCR